MENKKLKWGCIQPLTGGMYLGAEKAIGHPAEWIITYPGLTDIVTDKTGETIDAGNEANIVNYLTKHDRMPNYYLMNKGFLNADEMLSDVEYRPEYTLNGENATPDIDDMDIVVAVPVCAGLSMASTANADRKDQCNAQMIWMAKYALRTICPKVYIFENAPTLMSSRGDDVRAQLETIANETGYSCVYYKTDTKYHHNCQKRPRTFVYFFKNRDGEKFVPKFNWERDMVSTEQFFNEMPETRTEDPMNVVLDNIVNVDIPVEYAKVRFGENWREYISGDLTMYMVTDLEEREKFLEWLKNSNYDEKYYKWYVRYFGHIDAKLAENKGWWSTIAKYFKDLLPACMYKNVPIVVHHKEDRLYTMREWLYMMGHPVDFDMVGKPWNYFRKIGQNVPANTARWIVSEAARIVDNWNTVENDNMKEGESSAFFDNTKQKRIW